MQPVITTAHTDHELERLRDGLVNCIGCGCLALKTFRHANPADRTGSIGTESAVWGKKRSKHRDSSEASI